MAPGRKQRRAERLQSWNEDRWYVQQSWKRSRREDWRSNDSMDYSSSNGSRPLDYSSSNGSRPLDYSSSNGSRPLRYSSSNGSRSLDHSSSNGSRSLDHSSSNVSRSLDHSNGSRPLDYSSSNGSRVSAHSSSNGSRLLDYSSSNGMSSSSASTLESREFETRKTLLLSKGPGNKWRRIQSSILKAYDLPDLPYAYDALEPSIDKATMEFHHDKHHLTYVTNINKALEGKSQPPLVELQKTAIKDGAAFRNSGGGAYNHNFFWLEMAPTGKGGSPSEKLAKAIDESFGSMDDFKAKFEAAGAPGARFGSGWVWLVVTDDKPAWWRFWRTRRKLAITSTPNQDNPLMDGVDGTQGIPILGCDVWEHAYYLKYQYRRPDYIKAWWDVVNWNQVSAWYEDALGGTAPTAIRPATPLKSFKEKELLLRGCSRHYDAKGSTVLTAEMLSLLVPMQENHQPQDIVPEIPDEVFGACEWQPLIILPLLEEGLRPRRQTPMGSISENSWPPSLPSPRPDTRARDTLKHLEEALLGARASPAEASGDPSLVESESAIVELEDPFLAALCRHEEEQGREEELAAEEAAAAAASEARGCRSYLAKVYSQTAGVADQRHAKKMKQEVPASCTSACSGVLISMRVWQQVV
ncbi:sodA [Symbiodinium natans]|uniref:Superoxide dismutase [Fe] n=1 Tax=Symbiodinium natans TaxID=878477 RepID=A0A812S137_9DINO|nr:sodA [Symbiodinium natans]